MEVNIIEAILWIILSTFCTIADSFFIASFNNKVKSKVMTTGLFAIAILFCNMLESFSHTKEAVTMVMLLQISLVYIFSSLVEFKETNKITNPLRIIIPIALLFVINFTFLHLFNDMNIVHFAHTVTVLFFGCIFEENISIKIVDKNKNEDIFRMIKKVLLVVLVMFLLTFIKLYVNIKLGG